MHGILPRRGLQIAFQGHGPGAEWCQPPAGLLQHQGRKINRDAGCLGERLQHCGQKNGISCP